MPMMTTGTVVGSTFEVNLPAGGSLHLQSPEEQKLWQDSHGKYIEEYHLSKHNDLVLLGAILTQQIAMFRAQRRMNGMVPEVDTGGVPTGRYVVDPPDSDEVAAAMKQLNTASDQVRNIEKQLGIDKASREQGGTHTVDNYIRTLRAAAHERGVHIAKRTLAFERFVNDLRWRLRVLYNADAEDRAYMNISAEKVCEWARDEVTKLDEIDKKYAREKGKMFVGKL